MAGPSLGWWKIKYCNTTFLGANAALVVAVRDDVGVQVKAGTSLVRVSSAFGATTKALD